MMLQFYFLMVIPLLMIWFWNIFVAETAEDIGFNLPIWLKMFLLIPRRLENITYFHIINNIINEIIFVYAIINVNTIKASTNFYFGLMLNWSFVNEIIMVVFAVKYAAFTKRFPKKMRDTISIKKLNGEISCSDKDYSFKYEYVHGRNYGKHLVIFVPNPVGLTDINGILKFPKKKNKINVVSYADLAEELALRGIDVLKLESVILQKPFNYDSEKFFYSIEKIIKEIDFGGKIYLLFHKDNNRYIFDLSYHPMVDGVVISCSSFIRKRKERLEQLNQLFAVKRLLCIDAKYNTDMCRSYRKILANIKCDNYTYIFYPKMDSTFSKAALNSFRGGVNRFGRVMGDKEEVREISEDLCNDIARWVNNE